VSDSDERELDDDARRVRRSHRSALAGVPERIWFRRAVTLSAAVRTAVWLVQLVLRHL
jgi:hypothetical protein